MFIRMALHIIIDGYNLIRQSNTLRYLDQQDIQEGRKALVDSLVSYKRIKGHRITVVFDGTDAQEFSQTKDQIKGIEIRFSRIGEQADAVIKKMAAHFREKALVVTSDRDVADFAALKGATPISSPDFEERLIMAAYSETKGVDDNQEDRGWTPTTRKKGPQRRLSKKDRSRKVKLRKL
jgi:uncharacterized protein